MPLNIMDPTTSLPEEEIQYAPRPQNLEGLKLGLIDNTKFNSKTILLKIADRLKAKYDVELVHFDTKKSTSHSVKESVIAELKPKADFVIAGVGDWGGCSSGSVLDGILLEKAGIPAVSIITEPFHDTGREMARTWGVPEYGFLEMPHPIANLTDDELNARVDDLMDKVENLLKEGQPPQKGSNLPK